MKKYNRWLILSIALVLFTILTILVLNDKIVWFDTLTYNFIISFKSNDMTTFMKIMTGFASKSTIIILTLASFFSLMKHYKGSLFLVGNIVLSSALNLIIKNIICRTRPDHLRLITESGYSFPSGHAMASVSFYGFIMYLVIKSKLSKALKIIISIVLSIIILLIGISRIYLGVHYPSDILGGYLVSISLLIVTTYIIEKYWRKEL